MIRKLKIKFVVLAMSALFVLLAVIITGMNVINYNSVVKECDEILSVITQNKGRFPVPGDRPESKLPPGLSPETPYESRYFTVTVDNKGEIININTSKIISIDTSSAVAYAKKAISENSNEGFINEYRYKITEDLNNITISFLDCGRRIDAFKGFLTASISMALAGYIAVFFVIFILSSKILKPIIESYEKQRRFITDAGHEIKTPLTIINANVDILEMELDENNESLQDIKEQTKRLRSLTDSLVMLSRMEEAQSNMPKIDFPISEIVSEATHAFVNLAANQGKNFSFNIEPMLSFHGNGKAISQLVYLLLDNAVKYSPSCGEISLSLVKKGKSIILSVFNTTNCEINPEQLKYVFDRFYRTDNSRSSQTGGYGIGLSVAKAIVTAHSGEITATASNNHSFQITVNFPA